MRILKPYHSEDEGDLSVAVSDMQTWVRVVVVVEEEVHNVEVHATRVSHHAKMVKVLYLQVMDSPWGSSHKN